MVNVSAMDKNGNPIVIENENAKASEDAKAQEKEIDEGADKKQVKMYSQEEYDKLVATRDRLLEESKQSKYEKQKAIEEKLRAENNKDELLKMKDEQLAEFKEREMAQNISNAIAREAEKRNCKHWDLFLQTADTSLLDYDEQTGDVRGVQEFFDKHQNDPKYKEVFFSARAEIRPDTNTPSIEDVSNNWKKDPMSALKKLRAEARQSGNYKKYDALKVKMEHEGLIR